jgi:hypothetical protein
MPLQIQVVVLALMMPWTAFPDVLGLLCRSCVREGLAWT